MRVDKHRSKNLLKKGPGGVALGLLASMAFAAWGQTLTPLSRGDSASPPAPWRVVPFPGGGKAVTRFEMQANGASRVLKISADNSYGSLLHEVSPVVLALGSKIRWRWKLEKPLLLADLRKREGDDAAIKICALFDMSTAKLGLADRMLLSAARGRTTDPIPAATLCYVWDHLLPEGTELPNVFSGRVRFVVMDTGEGRLGQWVTHERDLAADFLRAFGKETDEMPPLIGIAVLADADNTHTSSVAYLAEVQLNAVAAVVLKP